MYDPVTETDHFPFTFWVKGKPRPKGSLVCMRNQAHTMREQVDNTGWRGTVARLAKLQLPDGWEPYAGPVSVIAAAFFEREYGVNGKVLPSHSTDYPTAKSGFGDTDKIMRLVGDALQDAGMIADDRFIVRIGMQKEFVTDNAAAGMHIMIDTTTEPIRPEVKRVRMGDHDCHCLACKAAYPTLRDRPGI